MTDRTHRDRWIDEVFHASSVSAEVKVFLLFLERYYMKPNGEVCEPRDGLAAAFGCHYRKITAKFNMAISGGLMEQTARGGKGRTAAYRATLPGRPGGSQGASTRHPKAAPQGAGTRPPNSCLGAADYHPMEAAQGAHTRPPNDVQGASTRHPERGPIYKARAHAHSNGDPRSTTATAEDDVSRPGGVVVPLFNEEIAPSLRSRAAELRSAARETRDRFDEFWAAYPRKVAKGAARKAWEKAIKNGADPEAIIWAARDYAGSPRRKAADIRYTAHASTWLNAERWTDEDEGAQHAAGGGDQNLHDHAALIAELAAQERNR